MIDHPVGLGKFDFLSVLIGHERPPPGGASDLESTAAFSYFFFIFCAHLRGSHFTKRLPHNTICYRGNFK